MPTWMIPWTFPVVLMAAVSLMSRPVVGVVWLAGCLVAGRVMIHCAAPPGRTAPGTHSYLPT